MKKILFISFLVILFSNRTNSQTGVSINTTGTAANSSAMLDISSTSSGLLIPRMTTSERNTIVNPSEGLQIYNTTTKCLEFYSNGWHPAGCAFVCGNIITDQRDGRNYKTVQIGNQCWMAENINYGTFVNISNGQSANGVQKYCYDNNIANCNVYGGLYEWAEIMQGASSCNGTGASQPECSNPIQGICPPYWHIPSHYELTLLEKSVGSNPGAFPYDESTTGWLGTDEGTNLKSGGNSGFNGLYGGYSYTGSFNFNGISGRFWSSTENTAGTGAWSRYIETTPTNVYRYFDTKLAGFSLRCVKD